MEKNSTKSKMSKKTIDLLCIIGCYIVMYGLLMLFMGVLENSTPAFVVFMIICFIFAYKSCKGSLSDNLSFLPWPVYLVLLVLLSMVVGCFTAPYHIGKWVANYINDMISVVSDNNFNATSKYSKEDLGKMSVNELHNLYMNLTHLVMPTFDEPDNSKIPSGTNSYGCKTWGEARDYMDLVATIHNQKVSQDKYI